MKKRKHEDSRHGFDRDTLKLVDDLIGSWSNWDQHRDYYLTVLAPSIVRSQQATPLLSEEERLIVARLWERLPRSAWQRLPEILAERYEERFREREAAAEQNRLSEAERRAAAERARALDLERQEQERQRLTRKERLAAEVAARLHNDFLSVDEYVARHRDSDAMTPEELSEQKAQFVQHWVAGHLKERVDTEQAAAIASTTGDVEVVARAGSGKTRTLVTRALFLLMHCRVSPGEMLLLAFNRKAAEEIRERLRGAIPGDLPHVMTFHALAHAIVHPEEELVADRAGTGDMGLSREIQAVIDEHIRSPEYSQSIRDLMMSYFRDDWERIEEGRFNRTIKEFLKHRRALPRETLRGEFVRSYGERLIANALFEHAVDYAYERNFRWRGVNYRPDFTIMTDRRAGVVIEYFGLEGDPDYDEMSERKRQFWAGQADWTFLEFAPDDITRVGPASFVRGLLARLQAAGVPARRRSEEEIWQLIGVRAVDSFSRAMSNFVGRCRKANLAPAELEARAQRHAPISHAEELFVRCGTSVYRSYLERLAKENKEDFDGLMWRATAAVRRGETRFTRDGGREQGDLARLRFVMIDEFQDFSASFFELTSAIREQAPDARFFCVGDDWQAINGFAGSDIRFFEGFESYFRGGSRRHIRTNHRSARAIVEAGNAVMRGRGVEAAAARPDGGDVMVCRLDEFAPSALEAEVHDGDEITPSVLRLIWHFLQSHDRVSLLSRRNGSPWYFRNPNRNDLQTFERHVHSFLPEEYRRRVVVSTVHGYKGLESEAVIVLDAVDRSYPLIHPHWIFLRIFGDTVEGIIDEERRLFYVATTRARDGPCLDHRVEARKPVPREHRGAKGSRRTRLERRHAAPHAG